MFSFLNQHVLIVSPEPWGLVRLSKHHYALALVQAGARVTFVAPFEAGAPPVLNQDGIQVIRGFKPTTGMRHLPGPLRKAAAQRDAKRLLKWSGPADVVWSFDNSRLFDLDVFRPAKCIHHCMDANMDFEFERAVSSADCCAGVTHEITERMRATNPEAIYMPHGWSDVFSDFTAPKSSGKRAFYAGNLAIGYIHWPWLLGAIDAHPEVAFVFAGNADPALAKPLFRSEVTRGIEALKARPNVELLGPVPAAQLPAWYQASDALLLVYDFERFGSQVHNSHKLTEYLASGTPVVATFTQDFEAQPDPLFPMARDGEAFNQQLTAALALTSNIDPLRPARMAYARAHSYPALVERMAQHLSHG